MKIKKTFLIERNSRNSETGNRDDLQRQLQTINQQVDDKTKYTVGTSPTSDNLQDYFDTMDRLGDKARRSGEDLGVTINREIGKRIETERAATRAAKEEQERLKGVKFNQDLEKAAKFAGVDNPSSMEALAVYDELNKKGIDISKIDPDLPEIEVELAVGRGLEKAKNKRADIETEAQRRFKINKDFLTGRSGEIELSSGEIIDIDSLKQDIEAEGAAENKDLRNALGRAAGHFRTQAEKKSKEQARQERIQAQVDAAIQKQIRDNPEKAFQWQAYQNAIGGVEAAGVQQSVSGSGQSKPAGKPVPAKPQPSSTTQDQAPEPWNGPFGGMTYYTPKPAPALQGTPTSPSSSPQQPRTPTTMASIQQQEPKIERSWVDTLQIAQANVNVPQPELTKSVAEYSLKKSRSIASARPASGTRTVGSEQEPGQDTRYGAKKATGVQTGSGYRSQISALAESNLRFHKNELKSLLEGKVGNFIKTAGKKLLTPKALMNVFPVSWRAPVDRFPFALNQAGWSKAKSLRGAKQLLNNPMAMTGVLTAAGAMGASPVALSMLLKAAGRGLAGGLAGKVLSSTRASKINPILNSVADILDDPATRANAAVGIEAIKGDPRAVLVDPASLLSGRSKKLTVVEEDDDE